MEPDSPSLFNEREISALLKRAAEIQGADGPAPAFGLSLAELQQVAAEAGIDPESVAAAAAELRRRADGERVNVWGGPLTLTLDRVVEGEVDEATWEAMVAAIRRTFNNTGTVQSWGQALEWTHGSAGTQAHVTVTPRDGRTRLQVFWNEQVMAAPFFVISTVLSVILIPIVFDALAMVSLAGALLYLGLAASLFLLARWLLSRVAGKEKRKVRRLMAQLEQIAAEHKPGQKKTAAGARASETIHPLLSLDAEEPAPDLGSEPVGRRDQAGLAARIHSEP